MKNKITLFLTISLTFIMSNCSGKNNYSPTIQTNIPSFPTPVNNNRPDLGTPISIPSKTPAKTPASIPETIHSNTSSSIQTETFKAGETHFDKKFTLPDTIKESSALIKVDNKLWTINDSGGKTKLYQIDEKSGHIVKSLHIKNARNKDWEDLAFDDTYIYIGDFGNNRGNRKDLKIYKIPRAALSRQKSVRAEIISFKYNDQKDFKSRAHKHNFDCEAMVAYNQKLYLFSKNWQNNKTRLYELSSIPGKRQAHYVSTFNTRSMVTGASLNKELGILLLSTYSSLLNVSVWAFTNYKDRNFFNGNAKKLNFPSPLQGQIEGITFKSNHTAYMSSEVFSKYIFSYDAALYSLDFSGEFE